jgi:hypothetical protein
MINGQATGWGCKRLYQYSIYVIRVRSATTYIGSACNFAKTTLLTPDTTISKKTSQSFQLRFRDSVWSDIKSSEDSSSYSNAGSRGRDKSSSSEAKENSSGCWELVIADQLETRRSNKLRLVWSPASIIVIFFILQVRTYCWHAISTFTQYVGPYYYL